MIWYMLLQWRSANFHSIPETYSKEKRMDYMCNCMTGKNDYFQSYNYTFDSFLFLTCLRNCQRDNLSFIRIKAFPLLIFTCSKSTKGTPRSICQMCSMLTIKTPERWRRSGVFIVNFDHFSQIFLGFLMLALKK